MFSYINKKEILIKDTHRGLYYEDGVLIKILPAGKYDIPQKYKFSLLSYFLPRISQTEIVLVDIRERDITSDYSAP